MVHSLRHFRSKHRQGSAALITTIAISAVLVVLFVGITTIATREIRQSISADNSNRALYAAEAGVEDAVRELTNDPSYRQESCNETADANSGNEVVVGNSNAAWTCRTVTQISDKIEGRLSKDESIQLNLGKARKTPDTSISTNLANAKYMVIQWNKPGFDSLNPSGPSVVSSYLPEYLDTANGWGSRAALLEITAAWFPRPGQPLTSSLLGGENVFPVRTVLASPASLTPGTSSDFSPWNNATFPTAAYSSVGVGTGSLESNITTKCDIGSSLAYNCKLPSNGYTSTASPNTTAAFAYNIENLMKTEIASTSIYNTNTYSKCSIEGGAGPFCNVILRIRPRYASTNFTMRFYYEEGGVLKPAFLPDGYATIDVTARSSSYYRRVVAKKQIIPTVYDGVFDNAIFSGKDICKTMQIYKDFRGAPDYGQDPTTGAQIPNPTAGKNNNCASDPDV